MEKLYLGIDIGSTTFKAVLINERGKVRQTFYQRTRPADTGRVRCSGVCSKCGACNFGQLRQTVDKFLQDAGVPDLKYITCTYSYTDPATEIANFSTLAPYSELTASKTGNVCTINGDAAERQGVRTADTVEEIARILYPGLF